MPRGVYVRGVPSLEERFWARVDPNGPEHEFLGPCWLWTGSRLKTGYGNLELYRRGGMRPTIQATHLAWLVATGARPVGQINHECDNPPCVNPAHLYDGSHADNMQDMRRRGRNGNRKLTDRQSLMVRLLVMGGHRQRDVAKVFGVSQKTVFNICHDRIY